MIFIRFVFNVLKSEHFHLMKTPWLSWRDLLRHDYTYVTIVTPVDLFPSVLHVTVVKRGR